MSLTQWLCKQLIKAHPLFTGCAACPDNHIRWQTMRPCLPPPQFPIDAIFTWVDDKDPALAAKRRPHLPPDTAGCPAAADMAGRPAATETAHARNNDELRYSLRSLERYAPWIRRIFILTDSQVPAWFRADQGKARIIDHTECIPEAYLPTFNLRVIEAHLHRIPGLSEHFIYCNDDFFLINDCEPADFFTANGLPYVFTDWRESRRRGYFATPFTPHSASYHNTRAWLAKNGIAPVPDFIAAHMPYPMAVSVVEAAYAFYAEAVHEFRNNKFRTTREMAFPGHAVPLWSYAVKKTVPRDMPFLYINVKRFDRKTYYETMLREKELGTLPPFLCLNDVGDAPARHSWKRDMARFLEAFFPDPSPFERESSAGNSPCLPRSNTI